MHNQLEAAAVAATKRDFSGALSALLAAWRLQPATRIAEVIIALGQTLAASEEPLSGKKPATCERWLGVAGSHHPEELDRLLDSWLDVPARLAVDRVEALAGWPADPRRDRSVVRVLERLPYKTSRKFWLRLIKLVELVRDPQVLPKLRELDAVFAEQFFSETGEWAREKLQKAVTRITPKLEIDDTANAELPDDVNELLATISDSIGPSASESEQAHNEDQLLQRVLDDPDDDEARQVLGDLLLQRGHPRGELISLQFLERTSKLTAEQRKRIKVLIRDHLEELAGPLAHVLKRADLQFERGFLSHCRVDSYDKNNLVAKVVGHPLWSTVVDLEAPEAIYLHPVVKSVRTLWVVRSPRPESISCLWEGERSFERVEALHLTLQSNEEADRLGNTALFPALTSLHLYTFNTTNVTPSTLLATPLAARLRELYVDLPWYWHPWFEALQKSSRTIPTVTLQHKHRHTLIVEADDEGKPTRLTVRFKVVGTKKAKFVERRAVDSVLELLERIDPTSLTALSFVPSKRLTDEEQQQRLSEVLKRFS